MIETNIHVKKQREELENLEKDQATPTNVFGLPEVQDKMIQTPLTLDIERNKFVRAPERQNGAWMFCSLYCPHRD